MSNTIIRVEGLGKKYSICHEKRERYVALRDVVANTANRLKQRLTSPSQFGSQSQEDFWALQDVSFEVKQGDRIGIIGRNGAGKSTLLKILSRVTGPTEGEISIKGRVASLLEVGTGFHPELTGRENIFLNGAILGMCRKEIQKKFDGIVAFSEVENFLDTPVKRYSSGMYVRLAFAVAAHLEPEILIVDEVLAVGDAQFQKKCLGKMEDTGREGGTVLLVSHSMASIQKLCSKGIYLKTGQIAKSGEVNQVVKAYLDEGFSSGASSLRDRKDRQGSGRVRIIDFYVTDIQGNKQGFLSSGEDYVFTMEYENLGNKRSFKDVVGSIGITDERDEIILLVRSSFSDQNFDIHHNSGVIRCLIKDFNLASGRYNTILFLSYRETEILDCISSAAKIDVEGGDFFRTGSTGLPSHCKVLTRSSWEISE
ncbi:MAG: ABC transporter ATP-binding protein [Cyanobacteria bacterium J06649_11]